MIVALGTIEPGVMGTLEWRSDHLEIVLQSILTKSLRLDRLVLCENRSRPTAIEGVTEGVFREISMRLDSVAHDDVRTYVPVSEEPPVVVRLFQSLRVTVFGESHLPGLFGAGVACAMFETKEGA